MNKDYIIISKTDIQKRIGDLKESLKISETLNDKIRAGIETFEIKQLEWVLTQSTPLIPVIKKSFDGAREQYKINEYGTFGYENSEHYIENLKLDI